MADESCVLNQLIQRHCFTCHFVEDCVGSVHSFNGRDGKRKLIFVLFHTAASLVSLNKTEDV